MNDIKLRVLYSKHRVPVRVAGLDDQYDDNTIRLTLLVMDGPKTMIGRRMVLDMGISDFTETLAPEVLENLRKELNGE